jgi:hypothetical protein
MVLGKQVGGGENAGGHESHGEENAPVVAPPPGEGDAEEDEDGQREGERQEADGVEPVIGAEGNGPEGVDDVEDVDAGLIEEDVQERVAGVGGLVDEDLGDGMLEDEAGDAEGKDRDGAGGDGPEPEGARFVPTEEKRVEREDGGEGDARFLAADGKEGEQADEKKPEEVAAAGDRIVAGGDEEGGETEDEGEEILTVAGFANGFGDERMDGEERGGEEGGELVPRSVGVWIAEDEQMAHEREDEAGGDGVEEDVGEVIAERVVVPDDGVEDEGDEGDGAVEVEDVKGHDAESEGGEKIFALVDEVAEVDLLDRVVGEPGFERGSKEGEDEEDEERGWEKRAERERAARVVGRQVAGWHEGGASPA